MLKYAELKTPFGVMGLVTSTIGISRLLFPHERPFINTLKKIFKQVEIVQDYESLIDPIQQLGEYFAGKRKNFNIKLDLEISAFQLSVLNEVKKIPYGQTKSYQEIANLIDNGKATRAVGHANAMNPVPIIIPCHRVIGSNSKLTGFGGGIPLKKELLKLENEQLTIW